MKANINLGEVHPQLSNNGHPVDGALVGADFVAGNWNKLQKLGLEWKFSSMCSHLGQQHALHKFVWLKEYNGRHPKAPSLYKKVIHPLWYILYVVFFIPNNSHFSWRVEGEGTCLRDFRHAQPLTMIPFLSPTAAPPTQSSSPFSLDNNFLCTFESVG